MLNVSEPVTVSPQWGMLGLGVLILATVGGNVLVCLAVCWETRLQSMANYFLVSLAIADLLVAMLVMPLGMLIEVYGSFPFDESVCVIWVTLDISLCTASIWHMCTMSMDRFFTLKYPMKYGRNKTHTMVALKITFVWVVSLGISSPIFAKGFVNYNNVFNDGICAPTSREFLLYGSILAFYVPLFIMVVTYILTIRILYNNQKLMKKISRQQTELSRIQFTQNGVKPNMYGQYTFLSPRFSFSQGCRKPSEDISILLSTSRRASYQDSVSTQKESLSKEVQPAEHLLCEGGGGESLTKEDSSPLLQITDASTETSHRSSIPSTLSASQPNLATTSLNDNTVRRSSSYQPTQHTHHLQVLPLSFRTNLSPHDSRATRQVTLNSKQWAVQSQPNLQTRKHAHTLEHYTAHRQHKRKPSRRHKLSTASSQPHLPSMNRRYTRHKASSPTPSTQSFKNVSSILDLESVQNFDTLSAYSSTQSLWSDFQEPVMLEKLSQIEAEMDLCLFENQGGPSATKVASNTVDITMETGDQVTDSQTLGLSACSTHPSLHSLMYTLESHSDSNTGKQDITSCTSDNEPDKAADSKSSPVTVELLTTKTCDKPDSSKLTVADSSVVEPPDIPALSQKTQNTSTASTNPAHLKLTQCQSEPLLWRTLSNIGTNPRIKVSKHMKSDRVISKRTASNEKKASKVLGIIFCVFVALWTPFFIVNILASLCGSCLSALSPALMTSITWLGWLSSLGNPIIYTMFNTAFRDTFYKILTCKYNFCRNITKQRVSTYSRASHTMVNRTAVISHKLDTFT